MKNSEARTENGDDALLDEELYWQPSSCEEEERDNSHGSPSSAILGALDAEIEALSQLLKETIRENERKLLQLKHCQQRGSSVFIRQNQLRAATQKLLKIHNKSQVLLREEVPFNGFDLVEATYQSYDWPENAMSYDWLGCCLTKHISHSHDLGGLQLGEIIEVRVGQQWQSAIVMKIKCDLAFFRFVKVSLISNGWRPYLWVAVEAGRIRRSGGKVVAVPPPYNLTPFPSFINSGSDDKKIAPAAITASTTTMMMAAAMRAKLAKVNLEVKQEKIPDAVAQRKHTKRKRPSNSNDDFSDAVLQSYTHGLQRQQQRQQYQQQEEQLEMEEEEEKMGAKPKRAARRNAERLLREIIVNSCGSDDDFHLEEEDRDLMAVKLVTKKESPLKQHQQQQQQMELEIINCIQHNDQRHNSSGESSNCSVPPSQTCSSESSSPADGDEGLTNYSPRERSIPSSMVSIASALSANNNLKPAHQGPRVVPLFGQALSLPLMSKASGTAHVPRFTFQHHADLLAMRQQNHGVRGPTYRLGSNGTIIKNE